MALPHLIKYVYTHGTDEVIRRGKKIHAIGFAELVEYDDLFGSAVFRVKDDSYATSYKVYVSKIKDPKGLSVRCSCPYNLGDICRHEAASLFQLQEMLDRGHLQAGDVEYDQRHTVAKMKQIDLKTLRLLSSQDSFHAAEQFLRTKKANIEYAKDETVKAVVDLDGEKYTVLIRKNEERNFDTSCDYEDKDHPLCLPKLIVFLQLLNAHGAYYFDTIRNWDKEKNKLLEAYGYSLSDDLSGKFEFTYKEGKPFLRVLDTSIKRVATPSPLPVRMSEPPPEVEVVTTEESDKLSSPPSQRLGLVFNFNKKGYPCFTLDAVTGEADDTAKGFAGKAEKIDLSRYVEMDSFSDDDKLRLAAIRKLQETEINKYVSRNSPFSGIWENIIHQEEDDLPDETKALMAEYMLPKLKKLFTDIPANAIVYELPQGKTFKTANLETLQLSADEVRPYFIISKNGSYKIQCRLKIAGFDYDLSDNESNSPLFFLFNHQLFLWKNNEITSLLEKFLPKGFLTVPVSEWPQSLHQFVLPLAKEYKVEFDKSLVTEIKDGDPEVKLFLVEKGDYLVFQPSFSYKGYETKNRDRDEIVVPQGDKVLIVQRNREMEQAFIKKLQNLHSNFIFNDEAGSLALKGTDVLKNNWFFLFVDAMKEMKTPVYGFEALKNFRFNTAKPQTKIFISSNTDWFDAKVDIVFGDQKVTVAEVKRALANKQQFVQLNDGTLGILPEEWIKKYSLLFRVGEGKNDSLKLSRYHLSVVDELYENRSEEELTVQLEEKYEKLREFNRIREVDPPEHLLPILRPY
ncbi:MAG: SNF2 helicase associated domain-containing protein, partial [Bacteroidetes bacterium]|nr:SNF2 helicase associated domain-containing protein [Bacteroidota bacterium]